MLSLFQHDGHSHKVCIADEESRVQLQNLNCARFIIIIINNNNTQLVTRHMSVNAYSYVYRRGQDCQ